MDGPSDGDLIRLSADGDEAAFARLYDRHSATVIRYAFSLTPNSADAQELLQDTFVTAWSKTKSIRLVDSSVLPWLLVVCRNQARNQSRHDRRHATVPLDHVPDQPDPKPDAAERLALLLNEIGQLSELERRVCELCLIEGYSYSEAAEILGVSVNVLAKRLERARMRLRGALGRG